MGPTTVRVLVAVFGLVGIGLLIACAVVTAGTLRFLSGSLPADGTVVSVSSSRSCSGTGSDRSCSRVYRPTVRFQTREGREVTFTPAAASSSWDWPVGHPVEIRYRADDPGTARISGFVDYWLATLVTGVTGVAFSASSLLVRRFGRRAGPSPARPGPPTDLR